MKTKIISVSPDQNVIEHESGLKTVFKNTGNYIDCKGCIYCYIDIAEGNKTKFGCGDGDIILCVGENRKDKKNGVFTKFTEQ